MKKFGILLFSLLLMVLSCERDVNEDNIDSWIKGLWVNNEGDSLCFDSWLIINNSLPYYYSISVDSLYIIPAHSSSHFAGRSYSIDVSNSPDELRIFNFLGKYQSTYVKHWNSCTWHDLPNQHGD